MSNLPLMLIGVKEGNKLHYNVKDLIIKQFDSFNYDAISQTSNSIRMGESKPTTKSLVGGTTGDLPFSRGDDDMSKDDTGTD